MRAVLRPSPVLRHRGCGAEACGVAPSIVGERRTLRGVSSGAVEGGLTARWLNTGSREEDLRRVGFQLPKDRSRGDCADSLARPCESADQVAAPPFMDRNSTGTGASSSILSADGSRVLSGGWMQSQRCGLCLTEGSLFMEGWLVLPSRHKGRGPKVSCHVSRKWVNALSSSPALEHGGTCPIDS